MQREIRYIDLVNGDDANDGKTFATAWRSHRWPLDYWTMYGQLVTDVRFVKTPAPAPVCNAQFVNLQDFITLDDTVAKIIYKDGPWTYYDSTKLQGATTTQRVKYGGACQVFARIATPVHGQLLAYYTLPETLDLSEYDRLSLWFYFQQTQLDVRGFKICLCSDEFGATIVDEFSLSTLDGEPMYNNYFYANGKMQPVTLDRHNGANSFGSSIKSIAL